MEDDHWVVVRLRACATVVFNPCFDGRWSLSLRLCLASWLFLFSILVLMEDDHWGYYHVRVRTSCSYFQSLFWWKMIIEVKDWNSQYVAGTGFQSLFWWKMIIELMRVWRLFVLLRFSILVLMEDDHWALAIISWQYKCQIFQSLFWWKMIIESFFARNNLHLYVYSFFSASIKNNLLLAILLF